MCAFFKIWFLLRLSSLPRCCLFFYSLSLKHFHTSVLFALLFFSPLRRVMTPQFSPLAKRHRGAKLVVKRTGEGEPQFSRVTEATQTLSAWWAVLCVCSCRSGPVHVHVAACYTFAAPTDDCVWLYLCVVKQMESVLSGTASRCEQLNELVAGSQSQTPPNPELTAWRHM